MSDLLALMYIEELINFFNISILIKRIHLAIIFLLIGYFIQLYYLIKIYNKIYKPN